MNEKKLLKQLSLLKNLSPDADFARASRSRILYETQPKPGRFSIFSQSLSFSMSMGLLVLFFVFATLGGVSKLVRNPVFPTFEGVGGGSLVAEADSVSNSIDVRISEVQYLTDVEEQNPTAATLVQDSEDEEIDKLLVRAKNY